MLAAFGTTDVLAAAVLFGSKATKKNNGANLADAAGGDPLPQCRIVALARAENDEAARRRVVAAVRLALPPQLGPQALALLESALESRLDVRAAALDQGPAQLPRLDRCDGIIHCAAKVRSWIATPRTVQDLYAHNAAPCADIAFYAAMHRCPVVYASTGSVVRPPHVSESDVVSSIGDVATYDLFDTFDAYGFTKLLGEVALVRMLGSTLRDRYVSEKEEWRTGAVGTRICVSRLPLLTPPLNGSTDRNREDWLHRFVSSCAALGAFPAGDGVATEYAPVDMAAGALVSRLENMMAAHQHLRSGGERGGETTTNDQTVPMMMMPGDQAALSGRIMYPVIHLHASRRLHLSLLVRCMLEADPSLGVLVNPAAFRYAVIRSGAKGPHAAAFLPLISQIPEGELAKSAEEMAVTLWRAVQNMDEDVLLGYRDVRDSMVAYAREIAFGSAPAAGNRR